MTIGEALARVDRIKPNQFTREDKIFWLSEIEGRIHEEINDADGEKKPFEGYSVNIGDETELRVEYPYDALYVQWLKWNIENVQGEQMYANNTYSLFEEILGSYKKWYMRRNRRHLPRVRILR